MPGNPKKRERRAAWQAWRERPEAIDELCAAIAGGLSLYQWACGMGAAYNTVGDWIAADAIRAAKYARARELRADLLADECMEIVDSVRKTKSSVVVQAARLRVEQRRWTAAKLKPRSYGDRVELLAEVRRPLVDLSDEELRQIAAQARSKLPAPAK